MKSNSFMFFGLQFLCWLLCANVDVIWQRISINQDQLLMLAQIQFAALLMGGLNIWEQSLWEKKSIVFFTSSLPILLVIFFAINLIVVLVLCCCDDVVT